jgi:hypothetical protein
MKCKIVNGSAFVVDTTSIEDIASDKGILQCVMFLPDL